MTSAKSRDVPSEKDVLPLGRDLARISRQVPSSVVDQTPIPRRVHFVGIGGVGMSGIAQVLLNLGYRVSGSDLKKTELTRRLARAGARIFEGHRGSNIHGAQVVVVSSAIRSDNAEVVAARKRKIVVIPRAQMLAEVARLKKTVTVSGSHGKTTTTSMVAMALQSAGADPTMIIGGQMKNIGTNARLGLGDYLVAEADESDGSFLYLQPLVTVVTNIDNDHMDHYKNMKNLKAAFLRHIESIPFHGAAILCADDPVLSELFRFIDRPVIRYGIRKSADWQAKNIELSGEGSRFQLCHKGRIVASVQLRVPGRHNVLNALAALAAGKFLGFDLKRLIRGLEDFRGVGRRLDRRGEAGGILFIDDYGHHPTEIRATLAAVRDFYCRPSPLPSPASGRGRGEGRRRLVAIFQPHRFTRTKFLHKEFGTAFSAADRVYVTEIYPAGEKPLPGVTSKLILNALRKNGVSVEPFSRPVDLMRELRPGDVLLTLGAGDVWKIGEDIHRRVSEQLFSL